MDPPPDFKSLQETIQARVVKTVKAANHLAAEDLEFQTTINPEVGERVEEQVGRLLALTNRLLAVSARTCRLKAAAPKLQDVDDIELRWTGVVDVVDSLLERVDMSLDEYTGLVKRKAAPTQEDSPAAKKVKPSGEKVVRSARMLKPQDAFERRPDNFATGPWRPILSTKPHATVPLQDSMVLFKNADGQEQYKHPYEAEIIEMVYPDQVYQTADPIPYQPDGENTAVWVDTFEGVLEMLEELKQAEAIAVDLEHHDQRTYSGLLCLMQISTRDKDWVVDTLQPWRHKLEVLNEVFADPAILKVFHGAFMDIVWLQRDLGLYVVGLFDTFCACDELQYEQKSLAFLLKKFVDFDADKKYQLADWRMRPLPDEMFYYARSDTHYLLYIYDMMRNELIKNSTRGDDRNDRIEQAVQRSKAQSLVRYEYTLCTETGEGTRGYRSHVLRNTSLSLNSVQFAVFCAVWVWRDKLARQEDENPTYVLSQQAVMDLGKLAPPDQMAVHRLIPSNCLIAKRHARDLWECIREAKLKGLDGPSSLEYLNGAFTTKRGTENKASPESAAVEPRSRNRNLETVEVETMEKSRLFGDVPISTRWEDEQKVQMPQFIELPWKRFMAQAQVSQDTAVEDAAPEPAEAPAAEIPDEEFTIKASSKPAVGKSSDEADEGSEEDAADEAEQDQEFMEMEDVQDDEVDMAHGEENASAKVKGGVSKKKRKRGQQDEQKGSAPGTASSSAGPMSKKEKARARRAKKAAKRKAASKEPKSGANEQAAFDYSQAPSVLNPKKADKENGGGGGKDEKAEKAGGQQAYNPYQKAGVEGVKGARKPMPIAGGRSATFKG